MKIKELLRNQVSNGLRLLDEHFSKGSLTSEQIKFWSENGYLVLPKYFDSLTLSKINSLVDEVWETRKKAGNPLVIDVFIGTPREKRMYFKDAPDEARQVPYKLNDLFLEEPLIREAILEPKLCQILAELLEGSPLVCNSLTFEKSSQQGFHFDTFYMPPPVKNKMLATWIALEDVHEDAGPLQYYPGSHKIPPYFFSDGKLNAKAEEMPDFFKYIEPELQKRSLKSEVFSAKAGDVLIWHSQLFHAGAAIKDIRRTRKSLVTHYFRAADFSRHIRVKVGPRRYYMNKSHQVLMNE
jgi:ectoine hydroxylase-related dioxygenase (phytanoyl-CoA dioxygenase family)